jgi:hypothetical protein
LLLQLVFVFLLIVVPMVPSITVFEKMR